jgi:hypothetical protein
MACRIEAETIFLLFCVAEVVACVDVCAAPQIEQNLAEVGIDFPQELQNGIGISIL